MLVAAAMCPCPPLLVPELAAGAAGELDEARTACADALSVVAAARPDLLVTIGPVESAEEAGEYPAGSRGGFAAFGVDLDTTLGEGAGGPRPLPASLAVAGRLLERVSWNGTPVVGHGAFREAPPAECAAAGRELADRAERVALLVMGDGSACRTLKAPGYLDERAADFDAALARALGAADAAALAELDAGLAAELLVSGRAPWQVLAGAASGARLGGELLYDSAPYGVGYLVAAWS
ncbi:hypothetical protein [Streptomyces alkaliterrae]|uniref:Extradiol ring-cleavage dioxygenase class III enzyme subunit B domain-containing protein n=1 Tax=Streptomyces alkaliterrae TaxID=2213162 RepID=A0A5P0YNS4_9ACTN|nr:hypothetical protein [Streptomyces alkaliterrae]MBB1253025.1 hypothetical protein [Streptomyces alkaliterrae]MBB1260290.1 hypothetical protein [Streptomyces alkaliterrae]MQS02003.1 hypothetical protein [Streptomyces alkaliterrae]